MFALDNRLKTAAELCRSGKIAADVGCDHAQLACRLAMDKSALVIASDVRDGPLEAARRTVSETGVDNVRIVKSDGLAEIDFADDVIICGMGGELIARIIGGFELLGERIAYDGERGYTVMLAAYTGVSREIDNVEALTGKITDCKFLRKIAEKLMKNADGMEKSHESAERAKITRDMANEIFAKADAWESGLR